MQHNCIVTLTTDFGYRDPFAGIMKGVILNINPFVHIVDITHGISPQNILEAAIAIEISFDSFPVGSVHIVVVDPGVGSVRRPILVATDSHFFIGPDNGVFSQIYKLHEIKTVIHVTAEHYFMPRRSSTFHGRDIFAPAAAWLTRGTEISNFGNPITDYVTIEVPVPGMSSKNVLEGEIISVDRFGNATTNIKILHLIDLYGGNYFDNPSVLFKGNKVPLKHFYSEAEDKGLYSLINSFGHLELFVYKADASSEFGICPGDKVRVIAKKDSVKT
jgi:S-adenosylmethionine hydrolase